MSYNILLTNGATLTTVADGSVDNTTTMSLVGRNYAGFGSFLNENFIKLLENSSNPSAPPRPLLGQLWWDSANRHLNVWQGTNWKVISSSLTSTIAPTSPVTGDFWWNPGISQLSVYSGTQWILVGPAVAPGAPITSTLPDLVSDGITTHTVGNLIVNNKLVAIYSTENSPFNPVQPLGGLTRIYPGLNMVSGYSLISPTVTTSNISVSYASALNTVTATDISTSTFTASTSAAANVLTANTLTVSRTAALPATTATSLVVSTNSILGAATATNLSVSSTTTLSSATVTGTLNAGTLQQGGNQVLHAANYNSYTPTLTGTGASGTWSISITGNANAVYSASSSDYRQGYTTATAYSLAQRDANGSLTANYFYGIASQAQYADLAERFESDAVYPVGTVMELAGPVEVTQAGESLSENVIGVISTAPAYLMNTSAGTDETHPPIALSGRVPVRVIGPVKKFDRLVSAGNGLARSGSKSEITPFNVIGRALESKEGDGEGLILAIVLISL